MTAAEMLARGVGAQAPDKDAPPEDLSDLINKLLDKTGAWLSKATGVNINSIFKTGIFAHTDLQQGGIKVDNMINMAVPDARGGTLSSVVFGQVFTKAGGTITDQTGGAGGGDFAGGGGDFGGGGGGSGGSDFAGGDYSGGSGGSNHAFDSVAMGPLPTGGSRFDWAEAGIPDNGFTPSATPSMGQGTGASMSV